MRTDEQTTRCAHKNTDIDTNPNTNTKANKKHTARTEYQRDEDCEDSGVPIQIAVVIVEELGILNDTGDDDDDDNDRTIQSNVSTMDVAEKFATRLHNEWGIGYEIPPQVLPGDSNNNDDQNNGGAGTGVLVFLSVRDRVVFISVGGALRHILTNGRIDRIIRNSMRPYLKRADYDRGLLEGIDAIAERLENGGVPSVWERILDYWWWKDNNFNLLLVAGFFVFVMKSLWTARKEDRSYARAVARLSELDLAKAEALRGTYSPATNCPICLQDFQSATVGSDGLPIRLLRCGHVFDETCYHEWVSSGRCNATKCPVCRADVGCSSTVCSGSSNNPAAPITDETNEDESPLITNRSLARTESENDFADSNSDHNHDTNNNAMNLFREDRNFRLQRLSRLYPRYVTIEHVTRWSSPTFHGSLARDPSFRSNDPAQVRARAQARHTSSSSSSTSETNNNSGGGYAFGGGTSAGGSGGHF